MASLKIWYGSTPKVNNSPSSICTISLILNSDSWIKSSKSYQESKSPCLIQTVFLWLSGVLGRLFSVGLITVTMIFQRATRFAQCLPFPLQLSLHSFSSFEVFTLQVTALVLCHFDHKLKLSHKCVFSLFVFKFCTEFSFPLPV